MAWSHLSGTRSRELRLEAGLSIDQALSHSRLFTLAGSHLLAVPNFSKQWHLLCLGRGVDFRLKLYQIPGWLCIFMREAGLGPYVLIFDKNAR